MKKIISLAFFLAFFAAIHHPAQAQQDCNCSIKVVEATDYCFSSKLFPAYCALFIKGSSQFYVSIKNKPLKLQLPDANQTPMDKLVALANNKNLKLSALDVLFIHEALTDWARVKPNLKYVKEGYRFTASGLGIKILQEGTGDSPAKGNKVWVHYIGTLEDGSKFDSSVDRGTPFDFPLGMGYVIKGWDEGIALLKPGAKAMLRIPPDLGYGKRQAGRIPPDSVLYFEVELVKFETTAEED
jgi:hypothetical protein